jgi:hypothetical protein
MTSITFGAMKPFLKRAKHPKYGCQTCSWPANKVPEEAAEYAYESSDIVLQKHRWAPVTLCQTRTEFSNNTRKYPFTLP